MPHVRVSIQTVGDMFSEYRTLGPHNTCSRKKGKKKEGEGFVANELPNKLKQATMPNVYMRFMHEDVKQ